MTHGMEGSSIYKSWDAMVQRCTNPNSTAWKDYGARGITVCERWLTFENFYADMGDRPFPGASLDRINNDGNYEPGNVRWVTRVENARNTRINRFIEHRGERLCLSAWAEKAGISPSLLSARIGRLGWTFERAVSTPPQRRKA